MRFAGCLCPNHKFFRNRNRYIKVSKIIIKFLRAVIAPGVPAINIIIHRYPGKPICDKIRGTIYHACTNWRTGIYLVMPTNIQLNFRMWQNAIFRFDNQDCVIMKSFWRIGKIYNFLFAYFEISI